MHDVHRAPLLPLDEHVLTGFEVALAEHRDEAIELRVVETPEEGVATRNAPLSSAPPPSH